MYKHYNIQLFGNATCQQFNAEKYENGLHPQMTYSRMNERLPQKHRKRNPSDNMAGGEILDFY